MTMVRYEPTEAHRHAVTVMSAHGIPHETIAAAILNPRTNRPLSVVTLKRAFKSELVNGKAHMQREVGAALVDLIKSRHWPAVLFGAKVYLGVKDDGSSITISANGDAAMQGINVTFVGGKHLDDDRPRERFDMDLQANKAEGPKSPPPGRMLPPSSASPIPPMPEATPRPAVADGSTAAPRAAQPLRQQHNGHPVQWNESNHAWEYADE